MKIAIINSSKIWYGKVQQIKLALEKLGHDVIVAANEKIEGYINIHITSDMTELAKAGHSAFDIAKQTEADFLFISNKKVHERYFEKDGNAFYLPCAVDTSIYRPLSHIKAKFDIGFIGNFYRMRDIDRNEIKTYIEEKYHSYFQNGIYFEEANEVYNRCRIVLNMCMADGINMRVFEGCATGRLTLTNKVSYIEELYEDKKDLVLWDNKEDLIEKINYYLSHEKEREAIAMRGRKTTVKKHDYISRAKFIEQCLINTKKDT